MKNYGYGSSNHKKNKSKKDRNILIGFGALTIAFGIGIGSFINSTQSKDKMIKNRDYVISSHNSKISNYENQNKELQGNVNELIEIIGIKSDSLEKILNNNKIISKEYEQLKGEYEQLKELSKGIPNQMIDDKTFYIDSQTNDLSNLTHKIDSLTKKYKEIEKENSSLLKDYVDLNDEFNRVLDSKKEKEPKVLENPNLKSKDKSNLLTRLFSPKMELTDNFIIIRHDDVENIDAFATYLIKDNEGNYQEINRKEPLIRQTSGSNIVAFKYPEYFMDKNDGMAIDIYAVKDGNETRRRRVYKCKKDVVSTNPCN